MNRRNIFLVLSCCFYNIIISQTIATSNTVSLYYKINEVRSDANFKRLDSALKTLEGKSLKVKITGFADFLHNDNYNLTLSQNRADAIKEYLQSKGNLITIISCKGVGEKFSKNLNSPEGDARQRKVEVVIETNEKVKHVIVKADTVTGEEKNIKEKKKTIENLSLGESLAIEGLNFIPGRHFITKSSSSALQLLLRTLQENENLKVQIQGHVCCTDGKDDGLDYDTHEYKLSENRAKAIYDFLVSKGIDASRLSYKGFGHSKPKFPSEATSAEEQANRRVEVMIVEK